MPARPNDPSPPEPSQRHPERDHQAELEALLLDGVDSLERGERGPVNAEFWRELRVEARRLLDGR